MIKIRKDNIVFIPRGKKIKKLGRRTREMEKFELWKNLEDK